MRVSEKKDRRKVTQFAPQKKTARALHFSESFRDKFPRLVATCTESGGAWTDAKDTEKAKDHIHVDDLEDYRAFLLKQRRYAVKPCGPVSFARVLGTA